MRRWTGAVAAHLLTMQTALRTPCSVWTGGQVRIGWAMPWVVGLAGEDLGKTRLWDVGLKNLENHLLMGMCLGRFLWKSNRVPRKSRGSSPTNVPRLSQDSSVCRDGQWQRDSDLMLPEPGLWRESQSLASCRILQATVNHVEALSCGPRVLLRVFKQSRDMGRLALPPLCYHSPLGTPFRV